MSDKMIKRRWSRALSRAVEEIELNGYAAICTGASGKLFNLMRVPVTSDERGSFIKIIMTTDKLCLKELDRIRKFKTVFYKEIWMIRRGKHEASLKFLGEKLIWRSRVPVGDFIKTDVKRAEEAAQRDRKEANFLTSASNSTL